jgi:hypothetical protein
MPIWRITKDRSLRTASMLTLDRKQRCPDVRNSEMYLAMYEMRLQDHLTSRHARDPFNHTPSFRYKQLSFEPSVCHISGRVGVDSYVIDDSFERNHADGGAQYSEAWQKAKTRETQPNKARHDPA